MSFLKNYVGFGAAPPTAPPPDQKTAVRALPASWYTSQEMYELERRAIFSRRWLLTTHQARVPNPGDWVKYDVAGYSFIIVRDRKADGGKIHALHNICRHRAFPVVTEASGNSFVFACKYHGWSYGLSGNLAKAPGYQDLDGFDRVQNGLFPIHVHIDRNGFVWINMDASQPQGQPEVAWTDDFVGIDEQERFQHYDFADYRFDHSWEMEGEYNWKILADNYNECYHCKVAHPDIPSIADLNSYYVHTKDAYIQHFGQPTAEQIAKGFRVAATYFWPNASMNISPHFFFIQRFVPNGPTSSVMRYEVFRNKHSSDADFGVISNMYKRIMSEDKYLCANAQKNINAGVFVNGEMHPEMEKGPLFFQQKVREAITAHFAKEQQLGGGAQIWPAQQQVPPTATRSRADESFCAAVDCCRNKNKNADNMTGERAGEKKALCLDEAIAF